MPKYRVLPKVSSFLHDGKRYFPGDVVELPKQIGDRKDWLERYTPPKTEKAVEPVSKEETPQKEEPFPTEKTRKTRKKGN